MMNNLLYFNFLVPTYPQQNGMHPQQNNFPMSPTLQMNHMMGNMSLQSPPHSMQNMPNNMPMQQVPNGMQITQPMTFNLQDSNQNVPVYQQQR